MINRLNSISMPSLPSGLPPLPSLSSFGGGVGGGQYGSGVSQFNPTVPNGHSLHQPSAMPLPIPEIKTEADLALFNQFMISLGRDAAHGYGGSAPSIPMSHVPSYGASSGTTGSPLSDQSPIEDLFNPDELASLGLTGMPGMPIPNASNGHDLGSSMPSQSVSFAGLYPSLDSLNLSRSRGASMSEVEPAKRTIASLPRNHSVASTAKPSLGNTSYGLGGSSYPELGHLEPINTDFSNGFNSNEQSYNFDSLARSKAPPAATLAPRDFYKKTYRHVAPLGTAVSARSRESSERSSAHEVTSDPEEMEESPIESKMSVRNLLLSPDDADPSLRLPALHRAVSREDLPASLPGVEALSRPVSPPHQLPAKRHTADEIVRGVKRLELADRSSPADEDRRPVSRGVPEVALIPKEIRRRHAVIIRSWLVAVNLEWRRRRLEELGAGVERMQQLEREMEDDEETVKMEHSDDEDEADDEREVYRRPTGVSRRLNLAEIAA